MSDSTPTVEQVRDALAAQPGIAFAVRGILVKGSTGELVTLRVRAYRAWRAFGPRFEGLV